MMPRLRALNRNAYNRTSGSSQSSPVCPNEQSATSSTFSHGKPVCDRGGHQQDHIGTMRALNLVARPHYRNADIVGEEQIARLNKADQRRLALYRKMLVDRFNKFDAERANLNIFRR
jgi:hypothetical protein